MAYKVIKYFQDIQDNNYEYEPNDDYPRKGLTVLPSRLKELSTTANRRKEILIKEVPDEVEEKPKKEKKTKSVEKADEE